MLSIDNVYSPTELHKWITSIQKDYPEVEFTIEHKWDGISLAAKYKDGLLYQAVTRGDGLSGNDVTANAKMLMNLPHRIEGFTGEIRGEVVIDLNDFTKLNIQRIKNKEEEFSNPRNTASIISSGKNPEEIKKRFMQFIPFGLIAKNTPAAYELLKNNGIQVGGNTLSNEVTSLDGLTTLLNIEEINKKFNSFPTDGLVFKVKQSSIREALGENNKFVKWARAYKFNPEGGITKLLDVEWSLGRTGALTPVGIVEPVELSGSVVSRMSMHNMDMIQGYNVKIGDIVVIAKAAEIIPQLVKVENAIGKIEIIPPETCPCCKTPIIKVGVEHVCPNDECPDRVKRYLEYVVSKDILDLKHFGPAVISLLYSRGVRKVVVVVR
jgi:DNA ligase (NAD+)